MKRVKFLRKADPPVELWGWLFKFAGLQIVVYKRYANDRWWQAAEYSTGLGFGIMAKTRTECVEDAKNFLNKHGSFVICDVIAKVIEHDGLLNS